MITVKEESGQTRRILFWWTCHRVDYRTQIW